MLALVAAPRNPEKVELREVSEPEPYSDQALIDVRAVSLNRGEMNRTFAAEEGWRPGWDVAGVVRREAADGSGPAPGTRVVGHVPNAGWAQRAAVCTRDLAPIPDELDFGPASTLPIAGVTALRTLRLGGMLLDRRVLITGAAGGVGRFGVQLAHQAGAAVTAITRDESRAGGLAGLGAKRVVHSIEDADERYDLILESVGGPSLAAALARLAPHGTIVTFGNSAQAETSFNVSDFYRVSGARLLAYIILAPDEPPLTDDLAYLARLVAQGRLDPQIDRELSWREAGKALAALRDRSVRGKAVLTID